MESGHVGETSGRDGCVVYCICLKMNPCKQRQPWQRNEEHSCKGEGFARGCRKKPSISFSNCSFKAEAPSEAALVSKVVKC